MNLRLTRGLLFGASLYLMLFQPNSLQAQNMPFQMAGLGDAPEGISLSEAKPHTSIGGGNVLGPHEGAGSFEILAGPFPSFDSKGNLVSLSATFTSGPTGYNFTSREGTLATDYGVGPSGSTFAPGNVFLKVLDVEGPIALVSAQFFANFEIDPAESTGKFAGWSGRWLMDAKSTRPFRLNLLTGTSEPFRYIWRSRPGTATINSP